MAIFELQQFDPCPLSASGQLDDAQAETSLIALDIQSKYLFVDEGGATYHEYAVPGTPDVQNCGGYVDKIIQYRAPALSAYLQKHGVSEDIFTSSPFPILATRSPRLDLLLFELIVSLRKLGRERVAVLDHGCTVAEHYDLLDIMLRAGSNGSDHASNALSYVGLDKSAMLLSIAQLLHPHAPADHFSLVRAEGSDFSFREQQFDLSLSVGVVNHTVNPMAAFSKILAATRYASVLALWVTAGKEGFWAINHSGVAQYFFSHADLAALLKKRGEGRFYSVEFTLETEASQLRSYVGLGEEKLRTLGSYHMVYSTLPSAPVSCRRDCDMTQNDTELLETVRVVPPKLRWCVGKFVYARGASKPLHFMELKKFIIDDATDYSHLFYLRGLRVQKSNFETLDDELRRWMEGTAVKQIAEVLHHVICQNSEKEMKIVEYFPGVGLTFEYLRLLLKMAADGAQGTHKDMALFEGRGPSDLQNQFLVLQRDADFDVRYVDESKVPVTVSDASTVGLFNYNQTVRYKRAPVVGLAEFMKGWKGPAVITMRVTNGDAQEIHTNVMGRAIELPPLRKVISYCRDSGRALVLPI